MKALFCIIGLTGTGKSTVLDYILKHFKNNFDKDISRLVYHTTRNKRSNEFDEIDYHFVDIEDFYKEMEELNVIEHRNYYTENDGEVVYFTTKNDIESMTDTSITVASIEQLENYIKYKNENHIDDLMIYTIFIKCDLRVRFDRVATNRCKDDNDFLELCRRVIKERDDWENYESIIQQSYGIYTLDNSDDRNAQIDTNIFNTNMYNCMTFINETLDDLSNNNKTLLDLFKK